MPLQLKYRPATFDQVIGNHETVDALKDVLSRPKKDRPKAYIFIGPSGCGKTTLARLTANALNSRHPDLKELNSADFRGIDSARDIIQQMRMRPMVSESKVWMMDECHKLTGDAQEALLKALEDAPDDCYFILATTDPEKLRPTFKRRCTPFEVKGLGPVTIRKYLSKVLRQESQDVPRSVLKTIARDSLGSLGVALMVVDKIMGLEPAQMASAAKKMIAQHNEVINLCRVLMSTKNWKDISIVLKGIDQDAEQVRRMVLGYFNNVLLNSGNMRAYDVLTAFRQPFYDIGKPGLTLACFEAINQG